MELLREKKLNNDLQLSFYNVSKKVAGDRWLVVLNLQTTMPLTEEMYREVAACQHSELLLEKFDGKLSFELERKRHFVDETEVDGALEELMTHAEKNMTEYLGHDDFAKRLFMKKLDEFKDQCLSEEHLRQREKDDDTLEEPADFSACFR